MNYVRNGVIEFAPMKDETILYDPRTVRFCVLNDTASFVWSRLASPRSVSDLLGDLNTEYRVEDAAAAERALQGTLAELVQLSFVEPGSAGATEQPSQSERNGSAARQAAFAAPSIRLMDESEVLAQFQVTSAGATWWAL